MVAGYQKQRPRHIMMYASKVKGKQTVTTLSLGALLTKTSKDL